MFVFCAGIEVIFRMASGSGINARRERSGRGSAEMPPNARGWVCGSKRGPSSESSLASRQIEVHGCLSAYLKSFSLAMKYRAPVSALSARIKSSSASSSGFFPSSHLGNSLAGIRLQRRIEDDRDQDA